MGDRFATRGKGDEEGIKMSEDKKERSELLLEDIKNKVDLIADGHSVLDRKIDGLREELGGKIDWLEKKVDRLDKKVDTLDRNVETNARAAYELMTDVQNDLKAHLRVPHAV